MAVSSYFSLVLPVPASGLLPGCPGASLSDLLCVVLRQNLLNLPESWKEDVPSKSLRVP